MYKGDRLKDREDKRMSCRAGSVSNSSPVWQFVENVSWEIGIVPDDRTEESLRSGDSKDSEETLVATLLGMTAIWIGWEPCRADGST